MGTWSLVGFSVRERLSVNGATSIGSSPPGGALGVLGSRAASPAVGDRPGAQEIANANTPMTPSTMADLDTLSARCTDFRMARPPDNPKVTGDIAGCGRS